METDEEIERLLGEIPRATSAPPDMDAYQQPLQGLHPAGFLDSSRFYDSASQKKELPSSFSDSCVPNLHQAPRVRARIPQSCMTHHASYTDESILRATLANLHLQSASDSLQPVLNNGNAYADETHMLAIPSQAPPALKPSPISNEIIRMGGLPFPPAVDETALMRRRQGLAWYSSQQTPTLDWRCFQAQKPLVDYRTLPQATTFPIASSVQSAPGSGVYGAASQEYLDNRLLAYMQQPKLELARQVMEDRQRLQHLQSALYSGLQTHHPLGAPKHFSQLPGITVSGQHQGATIPQRGSTAKNTCCRFYLQGQCTRGNSCPFLHLGGHGGDYTAPFSVVETLSGFCQDERVGKISSNRFLSCQKLQIDGAGEDLVDFSGQRRRKDAGIFPVGHDLTDGEAFFEEPGLPGILSSDEHPLNQLMKFTSLDEIEGRIYSVAKDQHGCRFLQRKFDEGKAEDIEKIFLEIKDHIVELMTDPFGNYLVQKLLEVCNESHCMSILETVTKDDDLISIALNMHGTRAVQKLIETLHTPEQISMVISALKRGVVTLIKDLNGNHVVQRCLQRLSNDDSQFIFDAAAAHCVEIASHRHGCCVLQRCVDFSSGMQRQYLVAEIAANALVLSQDPFGNYVVQYILELGLPWAAAEVMSRLEGSYPHLAMQKFSSNVVERCLKVATEENKEMIVKELIASSVLVQLLQDPFANYVVQSALQVTKGLLHLNLVDAIRPHVPLLRSSPYGKRILSRTQFKK